MSEPQLFQCPTCGGPLDYHGNDSTIRCPYCNNSVIVPEALRSYSKSSRADANANGIPDDIEAEIMQFVRAGKKIEAIKEVRELSGLGLKEAKDAVEALERGETLSQLGVEWESGGSGFGQAGSMVSTVDMSEITQLLKAGQKIEAIKRLRQATGLGLKESKDAIEALERGNVMAVVNALVGGMVNGPAGSLAEVVMLVKQNKLQAAAQRYQQATGVSLEAAREAVEAMAMGQSVNVSSLGNLGWQTVETSRPQVSVTTVNLSPEQARTVKKAAAVGGAGAGCWITAMFLLILLTTVVPILFAFTVNGGPLSGLWSMVNPLSWAAQELAFGEDGIGPGQFDDPRTIAVDDDGNMYVGDYSSGRLQSFNPDGSFRWLVNLGKDSYLPALDVDNSGVLYAVVKGDLRRFDSATGAELEPLPNPEDHYFDDLAVGLDGRLVVLFGENFIIYDPSLNPVVRVECAISCVSEENESIVSVDLDSLGNVYLLGYYNNAVFKYSPDGKYINRFGSEGEAKDQFNSVSDLALDAKGRIYVADFGGVIKVFDADGRYQSTVEVPGHAFGLTFDRTDKMYVVTNSPQVMRLGLRK
jgi:ribosomal protein L7/L12/outer membrane protein assembly factor BamB